MMIGSDFIEMKINVLVRLDFIAVLYVASSAFLSRMHLDCLFLLSFLPPHTNISVLKFIRSQTVSSDYKKYPFPPIILVFPFFPSVFSIKHAIFNMIILEQ